MNVKIQVTVLTSRRIGQEQVRSKFVYHRIVPFLSPFDKCSKAWGKRFCREATSLRDKVGSIRVGFWAVIGGRYGML